MSFKYATSRKRAYSGDFNKTAPRYPKKRRTYTVRSGYSRSGRTRTAGSYGRYRRTNFTDNEVKFLDTAISFNIDTTGEVPATGQLSLIPQGATESQRIGRKAVIKSIAMKGYMVYTPGAAANACDVSHMYLVLDTQCNGAAASVTDVFTSNNLGSALHNLDNSQRFKVLKHWVHVWNPSAGVTTAYNQQAKQWSFYKKCEIPMIFDGATGAITEIKSNNIFLLAGTAGQTDDLISVAGRARIRFVG